ncbi:MAG: sulfatase-like hydrolase/transferase [Clostridia bacterium]|nr:sulfatase-like hydrolase/transferase [Clostridia bacterium]
MKYLRELFKKQEIMVFSSKRSFEVILLVSLVLSCVQAFMHVGYSSFSSFFDAFSPIILSVNMSLYFLIMAFLFFLTGKLNISCILVSLITQVLLIINHYKIYFLQVPLKAVDLVLGKEATGIIGNYTIKADLKVIVATLFIMVFSFFIFKFIKNEKIKFTTRFAGIFLTIFLSMLGYEYFYSDTYLYDKMTTFTNFYNEVDNVNGHGFIYSFVNKAKGKKYEKPENYDLMSVETILKPKGAEDNSPPDVLMIMSEAFFDIRQAENLEFNIDPLKTYSQLKKEGMYGDVIVPGFAGETSNSEFEALSGASIYLIDKNSLVPYKTFVDKPVYSLAEYFNSYGFDTVGMHPGHSWFYNRVFAYKCMGFNRTKFSEDLDYKMEETNFYANDTEAAKMLIDDYREHIEKNGEKGYFNFLVTLQNHGPYINEDTEKEDIIKRVEGMDDTAYYTVDNYVQGLKDADNFLKIIKDYIETLDRPVIVLFFGDHLPFLDAELSYYDLIGYDITSENKEAYYNKHKTQYLIFSNTKFKEREKKSGRKVLTGYRGAISSNYLATELLAYGNMEMTPYFAFLNELKKDVQVFSPYYYLTKEGFTEELSNEVLTNIELLKNMQYYNLMEYKKQDDEI